MQGCFIGCLVAFFTVSMFHNSISMRTAKIEFVGTTHICEIWGHEKAISLQKWGDVSLERGGYQISVKKDNGIAGAYLDVGHALTADSFELLFEKSAHSVGWRTSTWHSSTMARREVRNVVTSVVIVTRLEASLTLEGGLRMHAEILEPARSMSAQFEKRSRFGIPQN